MICTLFLHHPGSIIGGSTRSGSGGLSVSRQVSRSEVLSDFFAGIGSCARTMPTSMARSIVYRTCVLDIIRLISSTGVKNKVSWRFYEIGCIFRRTVAVLSAYFFALDAAALVLAGV